MPAPLAATATPPRSSGPSSRIQSSRLGSCGREWHPFTPVVFSTMTYNSILKCLSAVSAATICITGYLYVWPPEIVYGRISSKPVMPYCYDFKSKDNKEYEDNYFPVDDYAEIRGNYVLADNYQYVVRLGSRRRDKGIYISFAAEGSKSKGIALSTHNGNLHIALGPEYAHRVLTDDFVEAGWLNQLLGSKKFGNYHVESLLFADAVSGLLHRVEAERIYDNKKDESRYPQLANESHWSPHYAPKVIYALTNDVYIYGCFKDIYTWPIENSSSRWYKPHPRLLRLPYKSATEL